LTHKGNFSTVLPIKSNILSHTLAKRLLFEGLSQGFPKKRLRRKGRAEALNYGERVEGRDRFSFGPLRA
jgi:hypothetical protein